MSQRGRRPRSAAPAAAGDRCTYEKSPAWCFLARARSEPWGRPGACEPFQYIRIVLTIYFFNDLRCHRSLEYALEPEKSVVERCHESSEREVRCGQFARANYPSFRGYPITMLWLILCQKLDSVAAAAQDVAVRAPAAGSRRDHQAATTVRRQARRGARPRAAMFSDIEFPAVLRSF